MTVGYVKFNNIAAFDAAHNAAKTAANLPRVGKVNGILAPQNQQTVAITRWTLHPNDGTVVAYVNKSWKSSARGAFVYKTRGQVAEYFPEE